MHLVEMHSMNEIMDMLSESWNEYWSEYQESAGKEAYGGVVLDD